MEARLKELEKDLGGLNTRIIESSKEIANKFDFAATAKEKFENTKDLKVKREILTNLGSNFLLIGKKLAIDAPEILLTIKEMRDQVPEISKAFEPDEKTVTKTQMEAFYASNPIVLRGADSNH